MKEIIYQLLPRLWGEGKFSSIDDKVLAYWKSIGVSYVWYTGIIRHSTGKDFVKGDPGSPYAISDYYDVNPYLADKPGKRMKEFESLVGRTHEAGLKLIIDFVPNHVGRDFEGDLPLHDYCDYDWTDTLKIDYSQPETASKLIDILLFWASKGVDGFRCDMVELVPRDFFRRAIPAVKAARPGAIFIAEVYEKNNYRTYIEDVGFDLLYDKSGLYDTLFALSEGWGDSRGITGNWQFLSDLQPHMLNFLENHDEIRFNSLAALHVSLLFNTAPFMLYFGEEIGEDAGSEDNRRTSIFEWRKYPSLQRLAGFAHSGKGLKAEERSIFLRFRKLLKLAGEPAFRDGGNYDLCYCNGPENGFDQSKHFAFLRYGRRAIWLVAANFSESDATFSLRIPDHAVSIMMPGALENPWGDGVSVKVPARDGVVLKLK